MMLKKFLTTQFILCIFIFSNAMAQFQNFEIIQEENNPIPIYKGQVTFEDLEEEPYFDWMIKGSREYEPNMDQISLLKKALSTKKITIFIGTWCEDTQKLLPQLYKTLLLSHCFKNYKMYALDRNKKGLNQESLTYSIERLPTVIILDNEKEIGRIVETTTEPIEAALLNLLSSSQK